jgi:hypothetical protein
MGKLTPVATVVIVIIGRMLVAGYEQSNGEKRALMDAPFVATEN